MVNVFNSKFCKGRDRKQFLAQLKSKVTKQWDSRERELHRAAVHQAIDRIGTKAEGIVSSQREWYWGSFEVRMFDEDDIEFSSIGDVHGEAGFKDFAERIASSVQRELRSCGFTNIVCHAKRELEDEDAIDAIWSWVLVCPNFYAEVMNMNVDIADDQPAVRTGLEGKCAICFEEKAKLVSFTPCGHTACVECSQRIVGERCHVCRETVEGIQGVFLN
eukprot:gene945-499_t